MLGEEETEADSVAWEVVGEALMEGLPQHATRVVKMVRGGGGGVGGGGGGGCDDV